MPTETSDTQLSDVLAKLDRATSLAGELIAIIRVNAMRGTFANATSDQIEEIVQPRLAILQEIQQARMPSATEQDFNIRFTEADLRRRIDTWMVENLGNPKDKNEEGQETWYHINGVFHHFVRDTFAPPFAPAS